MQKFLNDDKNIKPQRFITSNWMRDYNVKEFFNFVQWCNVRIIKNSRKTQYHKLPKTSFPYRISLQWTRIHIFMCTYKFNLTPYQFYPKIICMKHNDKTSQTLNNFVFPPLQSPPPVPQKTLRPHRMVYVFYYVYINKPFR